MDATRIVAADQDPANWMTYRGLLNQFIDILPYRGITRVRASYRDDSECATRLSVFRYRSRVRVVAFVQRSFIISPKPLCGTDFFAPCHAGTKARGAA